MTREEAIQVLNMVEAYGLADEAKRMAIEALSADAVSREFYEDAVKANIKLVIENRKLKEQIESADAVQGEWIEVEDYNGDVHYKCAQCGEEWTFPYGTPEENNANFCPNCGARMKGGAE